ncbi:formate dehydrogenase accessory sulfurtransferase FdhD [Chloroflexota bacterium]
MRNDYSSPTKPGQTTDLVECKRLINGCFTSAKTSVVIERELSICINEEHFVTVSLTPVMEREFVIGYLFGQGFIASTDEVESIKVEGNTAKVTVINVEKIHQRTERAEYRIVSGGGKSAFFNATTLPQISTGANIKNQNIFRAMNTIFEKAEIYKETGGVHVSGLFTTEAIPICIVEDIGRHNTLDRVIGYALINKIDCRNTFLVSTGRMASEMVSKICRANIPVVATKTAVTKLGVEIGESFGLTIIGFVRDIGAKNTIDMEVRISTERGMKIYTHPERILC